MPKTHEMGKRRSREPQASRRKGKKTHIESLEDSHEHAETDRQELQKVVNATVEECVILRYENSLLKRILFESGIDAQAELKRHQRQPSYQALAITESGPHRNSPRLDTDDGAQNVVNPRSNPVLYPAHMDQLEKEYEQALCTDLDGDKDLSDHKVGPGLYPERFYGSPGFQGHTYVEGGRTEALMPALTMGQPDNLGAPLLSAATPTSNSYNFLNDSDPICSTAGTPRFYFTAPMPGAMNFAQDVTGLGNSLTPGEVHRGCPPREYQQRGYESNWTSF